MKDFSITALKKVINPLKIGKSKYPIPYTYVLKEGSRRIEFFGIKHTKNFNNSQIANVQNILESFKNKENFSIITEGQIAQDKLSVEQMVTKYGDRGLLFSFTSDNHVPIFSCEPTMKQMVQYTLLNTKIKKEDILLWVFVNVLDSFLNGSNAISAEQQGIIKVILEKEQKELGIKKSANAVFAEFYRKLKRITKKEIIPKKIEDLSKIKVDCRIIKKIQDPFTGRTLINKIGKEINDSRDKLMALSIMQQICDSKKDLFIMLGHNHVFAQRPALEFFIKNRQNHICVV
jgi:hypothetical protein